MSRETVTITEIGAQPAGTPQRDAVRLLFRRRNGKLGSLTTRRAHLGQPGPAVGDELVIDYLQRGMLEVPLRATRGGRQFWPHPEQS